MLFKNVVDEKTYFLLKRLMDDSKLNDFYLVGGTALVLQLGHRKSVDLDLFTRNDFDSEKLRLHLKGKYNFDLKFQEKNTLKGFIDNVFIDCIKYDYKYIREPKTIDNIRILSYEDIIAMKLVAIYQDGTRLKDFVDIAYLSDYYTLNEMISFCKEKIGIDSTFSIIKGLTYFDNIDFSENVVLLDKNYTFEKVKKQLVKIVNNPNIVVPFS